MELVWVLDCADADRLADFWAAALGYERGPFSAPYVGLADPGGVKPTMLLQRVPHMTTELDRLRALGATILHGPFDDRGWLTTVLGDPEGNEFCVIVSPQS